eukprot:301855_1
MSAFHLNHVGWIILEIFIYIIWASAIIMSIYSNYKLRNQTQEMYIAKRSVGLFYAFNISIIFCMCSCMFTSIILVRYPYGFAVAIGGAIVWLSICAMLYFLITRNWMIYFKYNWTYYTMQSEWEKILTPTASNKNNDNWFISKNTTYGHLPFIYRLFAKFSITGAIITTIPMVLFCYYNFDLIWLIISVVAISIAWGPAVMFYIYIVRKTPFISDPFGIHWEQRIHARLFAILPVINLIMNAVYLIVVDFRTHLIGLFLLSMVMWIINHVSTSMLHNKYNNTQIANESKSQLESNYRQKITPQMVMAKEKSLHLFMEHLSKEYSMEILLSYIEFTHYQSFLVPSISDSESLMKVEIVEFPSNIPMSEIITTNYCDDNVLMEAKIKANKLYHKYIEMMSEFQINISGEMREKLENTLDDLDELMERNVNIDDLFIFFEDCKNEMITLQTIALDRWKHDVDGSFATIFEIMQKEYY